MLKRFVLVLSSALVVVACGEDTKKVDCEWFRGDNCWKEAVQSAVTCVDSELSGTFNSELTVCDYPDGTVINLVSGEPPDDFEEEYLWHFEVQKEGALCMSYRELEGDGAFRLVTPAGTFGAAVSGVTITYTCMDGEQVSANGFDVFECLDHAPGHTSFWSGQTENNSFSLGFGLSGDPDNEGEIFSCSQD